MCEHSNRPQKRSNISQNTTSLRKHKISAQLSDKKQNKVSAATRRNNEITGDMQQSFLHAKAHEYTSSEYTSSDGHITKKDMDRMMTSMNGLAWQ